ncbi:restriction endonuclease subunit S [Pseudoalteromonas sp. SSDWG2]|uniref:restriction endonuclease subunit S n=1 Tax=Pseudoalteromonas sp. SSDWG2 TaxID=3139391 RepID=UPI003BA86485
MTIDSKYPPSVKAGKPILGEQPHGWERSSLNNFLDLIPRKVKLEDDTEYDLLTVKRSRGGVVRREHLLGKDIKVKSQFEVKAGDFVISKRQIVHGACGLVPPDLDGSIVSNEYSVFHAKPNFDLEFFQYLSETLYFQQTCFHSSIGVHIEKMIFKLEDWYKWNFNIPPLKEQKKIAKILSTWDEVINTTERLIDNSKQQKKALMQQLLTGKKRLLDDSGKSFDSEWRFSTFSELFKVANNKKTQVKSSEYLSDGKTPIVDQGKQLISGYTNNDEKYTELPVIIFGDHTRVVKWVNFAFAQGADGTQVLKSTKLLNDKYAFYLLSDTDIPNLGYSRHMRELKEKDFKYPTDIREQERIASVLTNADKEIELLEKQLGDLKQEKKALMQQLLTGKRRVKIDDKEVA